MPHMIFLVDFVARGLGEGVQVGAEYWVLFGIGATAGPVLSGHLADRAAKRLNCGAIVDRPLSIPQ
nr:YbfB/YjiJ family MFS transporter [Bradyrhizobium canariense]